MELTPHPAWHHKESSLNSSSCDEDLHVLVPTKTYSTKSITSLTKEHIPIQSDTFLLSVISHVHPLSLFQRSCLLSPWLFKRKCFWWRTQNHQQSSSPKYQAWHSLKRLAWTVAKLTPWKNKL